MKHTIAIKNMVCDRCIRVVREELEGLGYTVEDIHLGRCVFRSSAPIDWDRIREVLEQNGFELLEDESLTVINQMKSIIIDYIQSGNLDEERRTLPELFRGKIPREYSVLSRLFSSVEGTTLEQFFIHQKIEKVKEWLVYDELSLTEIAYRLGYSSSQHLSSQFRKIVGLTPRQFKALRRPRRIPLDQVQTRKRRSK